MLDFGEVGDIRMQDGTVPSMLPGSEPCRENLASPGVVSI